MLYEGSAHTATSITFQNNFIFAAQKNNIYFIKSDKATVRSSPKCEEWDNYINALFCCVPFYSQSHKILSALIYFGSSILIFMYNVAGKRMKQ